MLDQGLEPIHNFMAALAKKIPKKVVQSSAHMIMDGETKYVKVHFDPKKYKTVEVMMITDMQFGHRAFKENRFIEYRDWTLSEPNRFVLLGGDIIDAATPLSIQNPYENKFQPSEQVMHLIKLMAPMSHRIIGYVGGNHERRTAKTFGDAGALIATLLGIKYSRGIQLIDVYYGGHNPFKISLWHGTGAARTKGARLNMLHRFMQQGDSQLYLVGHLHDVVATVDWRQHREGDKIRLQKIAGVMSSSFLEYWNTFAEVAGLPASDTMMSRIILDSNGHWELTLR